MLDFAVFQLNVEFNFRKINIHWLNDKKLQRIKFCYQCYSSKQSSELLTCDTDCEWLQSVP